MTREEAINEIRSWEFLEEKEIEAIQTLVPELRDDEDEIMEDIISFFKDAASSKTRVINAAVFAEWASYLERQKKHKFPDE